MSWQTEAFAHLIEVAKKGDADALPTIRDMIERSARSAPPQHAIRIAETILEIGREMSGKETEAN